MKVPLLLFCALLALAGCQTSTPPAASPGPAVSTDAPVENVFQTETLPEHIRRVVLLPVHYPAYREEINDYLDSLWSQAIQRQNRFEVVFIDRATTADWSGQEQWSSVAPLPAQLRQRIESTFAPDAILLCDVTRLESYQPLEIGLRTKLFDWNTGEFLWGVDGVWTRRPDGAVDARPSGLGSIFKKTQKNAQNSLHLASVSPRYFYYHLVESVAPTLPERAKP